MSERVPSFFLLVPGPWRTSPDVVHALGESGIVTTSRDDERLGPGEIRVEVVEDDHLAAAFAWGRHGPLPDDLLSRVAACKHAALVEYGRLLRDDPSEVARIGRALRDAGGVAVRMEASGAASPWEPWLERFSTSPRRRAPRS